MKTAGFTIIRNAIKFDYPVVEAITSVLPVCDAFYVGVGESDDGTLELVESIRSEKIIILKSTWNDELREGGKVLSVETNKVFDAIPEEFDWCFYIQSDECLHENDLERVRSAMTEHLPDGSVDGLLFGYKHFYGQYNYIGTGRRWYRNEVRVIRNDKTIRSYKDAQGFRKKDGSKLRVKSSGAFIYHYGWVKPPREQQAKQMNFHKWWHSDEWVKKNIRESEEFDYGDIDLLKTFSGSHPKAILERIRKADWNFVYDRQKAKLSFRYRILNWVENITGWRPGENRNYRMI